MFAINPINLNNIKFNSRKNRISPQSKPVFKGYFSSFDEFQKSTKKKNPDKLSIFYYNDTHGNSDQMAGVISAAQNFKKTADSKDSASLILSGGDNYSGADIEKNSFIVDLMQNLINVDFSAVGNHEIDGSADGFYKAAGNKNVKFIATNVDFDDDNPMKKCTQKSAIIEKDGIKYGFVGAMPVDFQECTKKAVQEGIEVMDFTSTIEALQDEIDELKEKGVNRIILLSHVGYDIDKKLVQNIDGIDIVISGHSHTLVEGVEKGENLLTSKSNEPAIIVQAGENGKYFGILDVEFDKNGKLKKVQNNVQEAQSKHKSPTIEYIKTRKLGESPVVGIIDEIDTIPENRRIEPCAWTCKIADSMKEELGGDIAIVNSANIRKVPKRGTLTQRDINESAPMGNKLIKTKITQKQLVEAVQNAAKLTMNDPDGAPGLLQGSGFGYKIDNKGNLIEFNIINKDNTLTSVDISNPSDNILYDAIYDSFVAQTDGETPELAPKFDYQEFDFDKDKTMIDYLSKQPDKDHLKIVNDNRIEILKTSK